ncbi:MAG: hypothetical protein QME75_00015 [Deltaproteobacteria bacterium]|nr:hypothetical protein [Deltaproteobacteria bacterium]
MAEIMNETAAEHERSAEEIRQDIIAKEEEIAETYEEISERIKEKLDWRGYVAQAPFLSLGVAAGVGFLASMMLLPRACTPMERITGTIKEEIGRGISGFLGGTRRSTLISSLWGLAATLGMGLVKKAATGAVLGGAGYGSPARRPFSPKVEEQMTVNP